ncbi:uncharacterized protein LOC114354765 isoform X3 [Ostrinia furnacalis]|uniref:uncharacterized protein LOC114354765 isoform X3 n=1 Tax=Ostrinia furnacalis TaxID=93504 RepID=UPI00103C1316|nr:uncharacterized protein LOC114354765 isoform X3 [Ostrinia furnacalis]
MSFVDLATLTFHRRNELEARVNVFLNKCDHAVNDIQKLKVQAQSFVHDLNCEPSELKEKFLNCMKQLDEFTYLLTDFNLALGQLEHHGTPESTPVHDMAHTTPLQPLIMPMNPTNLIDVLSEPTPSTSTACPNLCPSKIPKRNKIPKRDQLLIAFSSSSSSSESMPQVKPVMLTKEVQCELAEGVNAMTIEAEGVNAMTIEAEGVNAITIEAEDQASPPVTINLPAQSILQVEQVYSATIMSIDGPSFWIITDDIDEVCSMMVEMTEFYKNNRVNLTLEKVAELTYCAFYDDDSDCFYRALVIKIIQEENYLGVEVFMVDTGEVRSGLITDVQPLMGRFCTKPPYARCCHLAGIEFVTYDNEEMTKKQEEFIKKYRANQCRVEVDDNTSESLGVYVVLPSGDKLNDLLVQEGFARSTDVPRTEEDRLDEAAGGLVASAEDITQCPEYEDPVEAVTGYSNRDEADICKHYKGVGKTCFKGARCTKKHIVKHPDGWTLDKVEVVAKLKTMRLPQPDTWHKVVVTYVCHYDRLYVQFVRDKRREDDEVPNFGVVLPPKSLTRLVRDMNSPAARMSYKPLVLTPAPGELVAALYPLDNQWYRARVLSVTRADQNVEVVYVDYGNVVWVKEDDIRALEPRYLLLPEQAVRCVLAGVSARSHRSQQWAEAKRALASMVQDRTLDARIIGRDYDELIVELFDAEGYSVAEQLAAQAFVDLKEFAVVPDSHITTRIVPA